eukprot:364456-Chlamydomonas_euryale.AAC.6
MSSRPLCGATSHVWSAGAPQTPFALHCHHGPATLPGLESCLLGLFQRPCLKPLQHAQARPGGYWGRCHCLAQIRAWPLQSVTAVAKCDGLGCSGESAPHTRALPRAPAACAALAELAPGACAPRLTPRWTSCWMCTRAQRWVVSGMRHWLSCCQARALAPLYGLVCRESSSQPWSCMTARQPYAHFRCPGSKVCAASALRVWYVDSLKRTYKSGQSPRPPPPLHTQTPGTPLEAGTCLGQSPAPPPHTHTHTPLEAGTCLGQEPPGPVHPTIWSGGSQYSNGSCTIGLDEQLKSS